MTDTSKIRAWLDALLPAVSPFVLRRKEDVTGVSGTGVVADGVLFPAAGQSVCVVRWRGDQGSTVVWDRLEDVKAIHGHDGRTAIEVMPVGELIGALKETIDIADLAADRDADPHVRGYCEGWNEALAEVHAAIAAAIEDLHDHEAEPVI